MGIDSSARKVSLVCSKCDSFHRKIFNCNSNQLIIVFAMIPFPGILSGLYKLLLMPQELSCHILQTFCCAHLIKNRIRARLNFHQSELNSIWFELQWKIIFQMGSWSMLVIAMGWAVSCYINLCYGETQLYNAQLLHAQLLAQLQCPTSCTEQYLIGAINIKCCHTSF